VGLESLLTWSGYIIILMILFGGYFLGDVANLKMLSFRDIPPSTYRRKTARGWKLSRCRCKKGTNAFKLARP